MPGSIQVSVIGLMDLPSPPPLSSLSLKVITGKREYHTVGDEELSFPVMSLRENLIVALHDAEGEEILRTEFRTMLLLERGFWETLFPLKNGGSLQMKLQFSLSAEDRKRIREMRDSALEKKRMEKPWRRHQRSLSDNRMGEPITTNAEIITEEMPIDNSELTDPGVGPHLGEKFLSRGIDVGGYPTSAVTGERDAGNLEFSQTILKSFYSGSLSQISSQEKSNLMESFFLKNKCETKNVIPAMNHGILGNKDLKIDKEIHKVDIGMEEIKLTKNTSSHTDPHAAPSNSSMTIDSVRKTISPGKSAVLVVSAGTLDKRNDFAAVNVEKGSSTTPTLINLKAVGENGNLNLMQKEGGSLDLNAASGTFKARTSSHSAAEQPVSCVEQCSSGAEHGTSARNQDSRNRTSDGNANFSGGLNRKTEIMNANTNNNELQSLMEKSLPSNQVVEELEEKIEHPYQQSALVVVARTVNDESTSQNPSNELAASDELRTAGKKTSFRNGIGDGNATSTEEVNRKAETVNVNENSIVEQTLRDRFISLKKSVDDSEKIEHPYKQGSSVELGIVMNEESMSQIPSDVDVVHGSSYEIVELKDGYNSVRSIGLLGTWTTRHLCITTGSNLLRDFAESFSSSSETNLIESSSMREDDTKQQKHGEAYLQGNETMVLPSLVNSRTENSPSSLRSNGGLIEKGVRIVVVIIAFGLLLKSR